MKLDLRLHKGAASIYFILSKGMCPSLQCQSSNGENWHEKEKIESDEGLGYDETELLDCTEDKGLLARPERQAL